MLNTIQNGIDPVRRVQYGSMTMNDSASSRRSMMPRCPLDQAYRSATRGLIASGSENVTRRRR